MPRRLLFALLAMGIAQAAVYMVRPATSYRLLAYGEGAREVGLVAAAFALLPIFLAIPLGRFSDRRGGAPLLLGGCATQTVGCLLLAVSTTTLTLALASAVVGLGHLGLALGAQDVIARESDSSRHDQHFGLLTAGVSLGQLVGPLVVGLLLGTGAPSAAATTNVMLIAGGIAALATACAAVAERGAGRSAPHAPARRGSVRSIVTTRGVPAGILASIAVLSAADVFTAYLPVIGENRDIGPRAVGALLALRAAASIAARVGIGRIVRHVGRARLISIGAASAAVALGAMTLTDGVWALAALSIVAGFGLGFGQPLSMTLVVQLVPENAKSTALAIRLTGNRIGQVATPAAAGVIAGSAGVNSVFWLLGALLFASALAIQRPGLDRAEDSAPAEPQLD